MNRLDEYLTSEAHEGEFGFVPAEDTRPLRQFTVFGQKVMAHDAGCAQSFREDRKAGLIYGQVCDADDRSKVYGWEEGSIELGFCVYCG